MVFQAVQAVLMVVVIIAAGYFVSYKGWAGAKVTAFISRLILNITLPCTVVSSFLNNFTADSLAHSWEYVAVSVLAVGASYGISKIVIKIAKIPVTQRGVFAALFSFSNSVYIGLPVAAAIFGDKALPFALFFYVANTVYMNGPGFVEIARDGAAIAADGKKISLGAGEIAKKIFQPPLIAVITGLILVLVGAGAVLPDFLTSALSQVGAITSPLALMFVGMILQRTGLSCLKQFDRQISWSLVGRFIVSPALMAGLCALCAFPTFPSEVLTVQMGLPAMVATTIFAEAAGADSALAARGVAISTIFSFVTIPIYVLMFSVL